MSFLLARLNHTLRTFLRTPTDFDRRQSRAATHRELFDEIPDGPADSRYDYAEEQCTPGRCVCGQAEQYAYRLNAFEEENESHEPPPHTPAPSPGAVIPRQSPASAPGMKPGGVPVPPCEDTAGHSTSDLLIAAANQLRLYADGNPLTEERLDYLDGLIPDLEQAAASDPVVALELARIEIAVLARKLALK